MKIVYLVMRKALILPAPILLVLFIHCSDDDGDNGQDNTIELGALFQGGIIFYIDGSGEHGLICSMEDQSASMVWCDDTSVLNGADGTAIGTGAQNTLDIIAGCSGNSAALLCSNYLTGTYDDWYLPSIQEIVQMNENLNTLNTGLSNNGGTAIASDTYWTSTELELGTVSSATTYNFESGIQGFLTKFGTARVRAIRSF